MSFLTQQDRAFKRLIWNWRGLSKADFPRMKSQKKRPARAPFGIIRTNLSQVETLLSAHIIYRSAKVNPLGVFAHVRSTRAKRSPLITIHQMGLDGLSNTGTTRYQPPAYPAIGERISIGGQSKQLNRANKLFTRWGKNWDYRLRKISRRQKAASRFIVRGPTRLILARKTHAEAIYIYQRLIDNAITLGTGLISVDRRFGLPSSRRQKQNLNCISVEDSSILNDSFDQEDFIAEKELIPRLKALSLFFKSMKKLNIRPPRKKDSYKISPMSRRRQLLRIASRACSFSRYARRLFREWLADRREVREVLFTWRFRQRCRARYSYRGLRGLFSRFLKGERVRVRRNRLLREFFNKLRPRKTITARVITRRAKAAADKPLDLVMHSVKRGLALSKNHAMSRFRGLLLRKGKAERAEHLQLRAQFLAAVYTTRKPVKSSRRNRVQQRLLALSSSLDHDRRVAVLRLSQSKTINSSRIVWKSLLKSRPLVSLRSTMRGRKKMTLPAVLNVRKAVSNGQRALVRHALCTRRGDLSQRLAAEVVALYKGFQSSTRNELSSIVRSVAASRVLL